MKKLLLYLLLILPSSHFLSASTPAPDAIKLNQKLQQHKKNFPKGNLKQYSYVKKLIDIMYKFDQKFRKKILIENKININTGLLLKQMDTFHTSRMKEILHEYGWITISKFGSDYDNKAWILIQHADHDPFFQAGVLFILSTLIDTGETDRKNYAYLYDRVAAKFHQLGMRQKYGTQANISDGHCIELQPYEGSLRDIDKRREEIGLEPLKEYLNKLRDIYKK